MVHLDRVEGQTGSLVLGQDGSIISSSGDLSSAEHAGQTIVGLLSHSLQVDFKSGSGGANANGQVNGGFAGGGDAGEQAFAKWNRITVSFGDHSYVGCLSNKRIHVIKKDSGGMTADEAGDGADTPTE